MLARCLESLKKCAGELVFGSETWATLTYFRHHLLAFGSRTYTSGSHSRTQATTLELRAIPLVLPWF